MKIALRNIKYFLIIIISCILLFSYYLIFMIHCMFFYNHAIKNIGKNNAKIAKIILQIAFMMLKIHYREYPYDVPFDPQKPYILISNHQSFLDIISIYHMLASNTIQLRFIAKYSLQKYIPYVSKILRIEKHALVQRKNPKQALTQIKELSHRAGINKYSIVIFPEGTRHSDGLVHSFKSGGIKLIIKECPNIVIRVIAISGGKWFSKIIQLPTYLYKKKFFFIKIVDEYKNPTTKNIEGYLEKARKKIEKQIAIWDKYEKAFQNI